MNYTRGTHCFITWKKQLFKWIEPFINIDNSLFVNNIGLLQGGAISIESQTNIDEMLSVAITNSKFISHNSGCIYRQFSFTGMESILSSYMSILSIINVSVYNANNGNAKGSFLWTDLYTSFENGMVFKNAILMKNTQIRSVSDGQSAIYLKNSNVFITESRISDIDSNNGAIYLIDTALQLHNNVILGNTAEQDGGGLYLAPPTIYDNYDVCLSVINNNFTENNAYNYGDDMYLNLIGITDMHRESCIKLLDNSFDNNQANISQDNTHTLNMICNDKNNKFILLNHQIHFLDNLNHNHQWQKL
eukprot:253580_1